MLFYRSTLTVTISKGLTGSVKLLPETAKVQIPTPYGMVEVTMEAGKEPAISVPDGIELVK